jgi:hypothetical protein
MENAHRALIAVHVLGLERQRFGDAKTAPVEHAEQRRVADTVGARREQVRSVKLQIQPDILSL